MGHQQGDHKKHPRIPIAITPHCQTQQTYSIGMCVAEGKKLFYMGTDFLVRKLGHMKVGKPEREDNITGNE